MGVKAPSLLYLLLVSYHMWGEVINFKVYYRTYMNNKVKNTQITPDNKQTGIFILIKKDHPHPMVSTVLTWGVNCHPWEANYLSQRTGVPCSVFKKVI